MKHRSQNIKSENKPPHNSGGYQNFDSIGNTGKLTLEQLKRYKSFENVSEEEGEKIINTLYQLSIITYKHFKNT